MRDSLFGEPILWVGKPARVRTPLAFRVAGAVAIAASSSTLAFAIVIARALHTPVGGMLAFSAWCAILAVGAFKLPAIWLSGVEYVLTDKRVIWKRGRLRRSIDRDSISYAQIRWDARDPTVGDLLLVRAVPTGALRRTLRLSLSAVQAPDRVWAKVRGVEPSESLGDGSRPLAQRLDPGERVLWTAIPLSSPWTFRRGLTAVLGLVLFAAAARAITAAIKPIHSVLALHALGPALTSLFVGAVSLGVLLLAATATLFAYRALLRPLSLKQRTRYFVTDKRVLIRRGNEELHLDRGRIAYVIAAPKKKSLQDVFLVLDGPQARALAAGSAFRSANDSLEPMFSAIADADAVGAILENTTELQTSKQAA